MTLNRRLAAKAARLLPEHKPPGSPGLILEAALKLFAERGYAAASVREIAAASGLKPATIYGHYPSKEHILAELCRVGHEEQNRSVRAAVLNSGADPRDQIVAYVRAHVGMHTSFPMLAVVANAELHVLSAELGAATFSLREQSERLLGEIIQRGLDRGVFHVPNAWLAVAAIGGMGLRVAYWYSPEYRLEPHEVADVYAEYALRILAVKTDPSAGL